MTSNVGELETTVELDIADGFRFGLLTGAQLAGQILDEGGDDGSCDDCSCGRADGDTTAITLAPDHAKGSLYEFNKELRYLLEFYFPQIDEDTVVGAVEICADDLPTAHVRE